MNGSSTLFPYEFSDRFAAACGRQPEVIASAPGRVNLIGEHTDYNEGFVLPVAIDRRTWVAVAPRADDRVWMRTETTGEEADLTLEQLDGHRNRGWSSYVAGVVALLRREGMAVRGMDILITSTVPLGAGLSSSAALEVSVAVGTLALAGRSLPSLDIARLCQRAEWEWAGVQCGIMDQFIAASGKSKTALFLDCRSLTYEQIPLDPSLQLVVCDTAMPHTLAASEYNKRRAECAEAVHGLSARIPGIRTLRDVNDEDLHTHGDCLAAIPRRRAEHVVTENARVHRAVDALWLRDHRALGDLVNASHASLRDSYAVSCMELDVMAEICRIGPGVYGARMTGAGFGGCVLALTDPAVVPALTRTILEEFPARTGRTPTVIVCTVGDGARAIRVG
ncbi:MAG: galactokinase [Bacteroidota bacterium]